MESTILFINKQNHYCTTEGDGMIGMGSKRDSNGKPECNSTLEQAKKRSHDEDGIRSA
jgi:hypothetical protein